MKEAIKIYEKNNCTFEIKNYTFSNIYYNWRRESNIFTKYSVFTNQYTNNNEIFLRDYSLNTIYCISRCPGFHFVLDFGQKSRTM